MRRESHYRRLHGAEGFDRVGAAAVTIFPADIEKVPEPLVRSRFTDLRSFRLAAPGGHFPMLEVPGLYVNELRRGLGPMPW